MKKTFIRNFFLVIILVGVLVLVCTFSYSYISNQIITDNINSNLKKIISTSTISIEQQFQMDYDRLGKKINAYTKDVTGADNVERVNNKLAVLNSHLDEILYPSGYVSGIGGYVEDDVKGDYYLINDVKYQDANSADKNADKQYNVIVCDLASFRVDTGMTNEFTGNNTHYVIYQFGDIVVYVRVTDLLGPALTDLDIVDDYYFINLDGGIRYTTSSKKDLIFHDMLTKEGNAYSSLNILVYDPISNIKMNDDYLIINNIKYNNKTEWLLASNLATEGVSNNLYFIMFIDNEAGISALRTVFSPLLATFFLVLIIVGVALVITYYLISKKSNDINNILYKKYGKSVFEIKAKTDGTITYMSKELKDLLINPQDYKNFSNFKFTEDYEDIVKALFKQLPFTLHLDKEDTKNHQDLILRCSVLKEFNHYSIILLDSTNIEEKNTRYRELAIYNPITHNPNMEVYKEDVDEEVYNIKSGKNLFKSSLLLVYLSNYSNLRLFYGKSVGADIQRIIDGIIKEVIENKDVRIYSLSSSKIGLIYSGIESYDEAMNLAQELDKALKKPIEFDDNRIIIETLISIYNLDPNTFTLNSADVIVDGLERLVSRMEAVNQKRIDVFTPSVEKYITGEELLEQDLRTALHNNEFVMYLQPQYNIFEHRIESFELLIRWNNPKYIHESPMRYIKAAEQNGMITQIGRFVNEESLRIAKELEQYNLKFSLNVSPAQFIQTGFVGDLLDLIEKYQVDPKNICLEVTETFLMENFSIMTEKLRELKRYGFQVHLDDFGTGHSSLLYLKELPIDTIKIDKEFTRFISSDRFSRDTVRFITSLARNLGLGIICEGVEDEKQLQFLARYECSIIQGYIISPPVPIEKAIELIKEYNIDKTKIINEDKEKKKR